LGDARVGDLVVRVAAGAADLDLAAVGQARQVGRDPASLTSPRGARAYRDRAGGCRPGDAVGVPT
jgi:hypothetical protein